MPGSRNTVVRSPLSARVIFNVDDGDVNVLDITKNKHRIDYHLGESEVTVYVVQEFERDFVEDVRRDPIEVTFDKGTKKVLSQSLEKMTGSQDDEFYWATCQQEHDDLTVDVFMEAGAEERRNRKAPNLMALEELRETGKRVLWEHDQGYLTMLCLDPRRIPTEKLGLETGHGDGPPFWTETSGGGARKGAREKWMDKWHKLMLRWSFTIGSRTPAAMQKASTSASRKRGRC